MGTAAPLEDEASFDSQPKPFQSFSILRTTVPDSISNQRRAVPMRKRVFSRVAPLAVLVVGVLASPRAASCAAEVRPVSKDVHLVLKQVTPDRYPGASSVVVFDSTVVHVHETGYAETRKHTLTKLLKPSAVKARSVLRVTYDPLSNETEIVSVRVHKADGKIVDVDLGSVEDLSAPAGIILWDNRMKVLQLPHLEVGDAVEVTTLRRGFRVAYLQTEPEERFIPPMRGHFYDVVYFSAWEPVLERRYELRLPKDKPIQFKVYNGEVSSSETFNGDTLVYVWEKKNIKPFEREPQMVSFSDVATKVVMATVPDWFTKSRWFFKINEPSLKATPEIAQKAKEIVRGLRSDDEKIAALVHWVAQNVRYLGLSMGKGEGYTIHPAWMTFRDRGGVCKDKAGLLIAMLRSLGYEAYAVMTEAGSRVERIPADQFNHCVAAVRTRDGNLRLLDPTWAPNSRELWSSAEARQDVVVGTPEGRDLEQAPYFPPETNYLRMKIRSQLQPDGALIAHVKVTADGAPDTQIRRRLARTPLRDRERTLRRFFSEALPAAKVRRVSWSDPEDFSRPSSLEAEVEIPGYAVVAGDSMLVQPIGQFLPFSRAWGADFLNLDRPKQRKYPFRVRATRLVEITEELRLPKGFGLLKAPRDQHISGPEAEYAYEVRRDKKKLVLRVQFSIKHRILPAESYPNVRKAVSCLKQHTHALVVLAR